MGGYNVGSDTKLVITSAGNPLVSQILTNFNAQQVATELKSVAIDGVNRYRYLEEGWKGTLAWDRADSALDDFFAAKEAGRYAGIQPPIMTIVETTTNVDGSVVVYRYQGVTVKMDDIGDRSGDKKVDEKVSWSASRRIKLQ